MNKVITKSLLGLVSILALLAVIYQVFNPDEKMHYVRLMMNNWLVVTSTIVIVVYLLVKSYLAIVSAESTFLSTLKLSLLIGLAMVLVLNIIFTIDTTNAFQIQIRVAIRLIALLGLALVLENYVIREVDFKQYLMLSIYGIFMMILVFIFTNTELSYVMTGYYFTVFAYLVILYFRSSEYKITWSKQVGFFIILAGLLNDLIILSTGWLTYEMSFTAVGLAILVIYLEKGVKRYKILLQLENKIVELTKENKRLKIDKEKTLKSVELLKSDLSYKFMKKQNYFENLELAVEVLEGSIIVLNDAFKIELAYGSILEASGMDDMTGVDVSGALFDVSSDEGQYFKSVVIKIFNAVDEVRESLYLSLLDKRLRIGNVVYEMNYHVMGKKNGKKVLIIHADVLSSQTQQGFLLEREKEISEMLITISKNADKFFADLSSFIQFCREHHTYIDTSIPVNENIFKILRKVHTYKGVFDQYIMKSTVRGLHDIENELFNMLHNQTELTIEQFSSIILGYDMESILNPDLSTINSKLGYQFLEKQKRMSVDMTAFDRLLIKMQETFGQDHDLILEMVKLKYIDVREVLESYGQYVRRIAEEQSKKVNYFVTGDHIKISRLRHISFFESMIHILKNAVAHGVEYPDERRNRGKSPVAEIKCHVKSYEDHLLLTISDDGRGVDVKEIKNRLFIMGKYTIEELDAMSDASICNMIVEDGITSANMPNSLAGRGVGMGSIREVVTQLSGHIEVKSQAGRGVVYEITLPYEQAGEMEVVDYDKVIENLSLQIERILTKSYHRNTLGSSWSMGRLMGRDIELLEVTCTLDILGTRETKLCISLDEKLIMHLISAYGLQMKYKGSNIKVMNEAVIMFVEDVSKQMIENLNNPQLHLQLSEGQIISTNAFRNLFDAKEVICSTIDISEGKLTAMVLNNSRMIGE